MEVNPCGNAKSIFVAPLSLYLKHFSISVYDILVDNADID